MQHPTLDRRRFLGIAAGTGAVALAAACGTGPEPAAAPRAGGRLRAVFAGGGAREVLDPHRANLFVEAARAKALYDKLADLGSDVAPRPRLAERWEPDPSLTRWRITLRQAVFHDGRPLRAADVLASYARILDPAQALRARSSLAVIDLAASRAVDDRTVEFALRRPFVEFPNVLAAFGAYIVPEGHTDFDRPNGTGPFAFRTFEPGRSTLLARFADHWDGAPHLDELEFLLANEESARINALLGGQVEYAHDLSATTARSHEAGGRVAVVRSANSLAHGFAMKLDRPPFDRRELREALFLLTDRQQLVDSVLSGAGQVGNDLFGRGYQYYDDAIPQRTVDLDRARALVRAAGADGARIDLLTSTASAGMVEAATVLADQARAAGLTLNVVQGNKDTYWADTLNTGALTSFRSGTMPIETHIAQRLLGGASNNVTKWNRPEFDALYDTAVATADPAARTEVYARMQRLLHSDGGYLWWGFGESIVGTARSVSGVASAPANTLDWARFDKVWMA
ncbi:ABC transporter substrate-binding protein [Nocardia sp. NPDC057227]|uniref:ABC transporter substrate-binding protein n=1 Tax=Nocardia sp. NPDC057227 TaxID=3346056 RepID=UPI0036268172